MQICKCLNVRERVKVIERKIGGPLPSLLSCEASVSVKENPDDKNWTFLNFKKKKKKRANHNKFMAKDLRNAIMDRPHLRNKFNQNRTSDNSHEYKRQPTNIASLKPI